MILIQMQEVQSRHNLMKQEVEVQKTPTVYFNFDDSYQKTNGSKDFVPFDYSCSQQKYELKPVNQTEKLTQCMTFRVVEEPEEQVESKLKTQEFFDEFENNFIVKFEDDHLQLQENKLTRNIQSNEALGQHFLEIQDLGLISISVPGKLNKHASLKEDQKATISQIPFQNSIGSIQNHLFSTMIDSKIKASPIPSFQIKKRTVFKDKSNLDIKFNCNKITKRKEENQPKNTFLSFHDNYHIQPKSCSVGDKKVMKRQRFYSSQIPKKIGTINENIFKNTHQFFRQTLKSTTLDQWKKKFHLQKQSLDKKTIKRNSNIFNRPFLLR